MEEKRIPTGIEVHNGMLYLGDRIRYDDGWLCFETVVSLKEELLDFIMVMIFYAFVTLYEI